MTLVFLYMNRTVDATTDIDIGHITYITEAAVQRCS